MTLNPDALGSTVDPIELSWDSKDTLLYAVGVGAGHEELAFSTENSTDIPQLVLPTFPVVIGYNRPSPIRNVGPIDSAMVVHGQQAITLHRPMPAEGTVSIDGELTAMWDKGSGSVVETRSVARMGGEPLYTLTSSAFIRGVSGWGGERGPSGPKNEPPATDPDHVASYQTSRDQAYVYRLSGDRNPLHTDPAFAALGGFDTPILHGLCTYGFTGRALLHSICGSDPTKFHHIEGRFKSPVYPGEALTIRMWASGDGATVFTTSAGSGDSERVVIDQGLLRHS